MMSVQTESLAMVQKIFKFLGIVSKILMVLCVAGAAFLLGPLPLRRRNRGAKENRDK